MHETPLPYEWPFLLACGIGCALIYLLGRVLWSLSESWVTKHPEASTQLEHALGIEVVTPATPLWASGAGEQAQQAHRPAFLAVLAVLGMAGAAGGALVGLVILAGGDIFGLAPIGVSALVLAVSLGLWSGRYVAWIAIQFIWALNILLSFYQAATMHPAALIAAVPSFLLFFYVHTEAVKKFCAAGKPK